MFKIDSPSQEQIKKATKELAKIACMPFDKSAFRDKIIEVKQRNEQIIDRLSKDEVILAQFDSRALERSKEIISNFKRFIEEKKDEIIALQIIYNMPYFKQRLTFEEIKELAEAIQRPPYQLSADLVWKAYEQLEKSRVRGAGPSRLLTDIIALVRFAAGKSEVLEPFPETVNQRFNKWLGEHQQRTGTRFTIEQSVLK